MTTRYNWHPAGMMPEPYGRYIGFREHEVEIARIVPLKGGVPVREWALQQENERLRAALQDLADCCGHDDDKALLLALRNAAEALLPAAINGEPQSAEHACTCDHEDGHHFDDGNGMVRCRSTADCKCAYPLK